MPIGPWLAPLITGLFNFAGGALAGEDGPQERKSFAGTTVDPKQLLAEFTNNTNGLGQIATDKLRTGTHLRAVAPTPPGFKVSDPAAIDPKLLDYPGPDMSSLTQGLFRRPVTDTRGVPETPEERRERRTGRRDDRGIR